MTKPRRRQRRPRGSGVVRKLKDNKYVVGADVPRATPDEKRKTKYVTVTGTMDDARKRLRQLQDELSRGVFVEDEKLTVNDLCDRYLEAKAISREVTTVEWYRRHFAQHIRPVIGAVRLRDLKTAQIQSLLSKARNQSRTQRRGEPLNPRSLRNLLIGIRAALAWGVRQGLVVRNVADNVEPPALGHVERQIVSLHDVCSILSCAERTELEAIIPFSLGTGLRRSETCGLKWSDLDLEAGTICVQRAAVNVGGKVILKSTKTKRSSRTDYLPPFVITVLRKHRADQARRHDALGIFRLGEDRHVFDRADGRSWDPNELSRMFSRLVRKHQLPAIRFHDLRHSYATFSFAAGVPLKVVSESLGHSSIGITSAIYVHLLDDAKRDKADALEAYLGSTVQALPKASSDR